MSTTQNPRITNLYYSGIIGLAGAILVGIGEFLLHYSSGAYSIGSFDFFLQIPDWRLTFGHFLTVLFIPLYLMGYWHLYLALYPGNPLLARVLFFAGCFALVADGIWAGSRAILGAIVKSADGSTSDYLQTFYDGHYELMWTLLAVVGFLISILFVVAILQGNTFYPKWMAFFNPFLIIALIFLIDYILPSIGQYLTPTAVNIGHFIIFSISLWITYPHWTKR